MMNTCILERKPGRDGCAAGECKTCGWRSDNYEERLGRIKKEGLTECEDGLRRLIIPKKGGTEND